MAHNLFGDAIAGTAGAICAPLQAMQSLVQLYNAISDAQKAMTFLEKRGKQLEDRLMYVAHRLRKIAEDLQADIQAGRVSEEDAYHFNNRVTNFRKVLQEALKVLKGCHGSMLYRFAYARPLKEDILDVDVQINNYIQDIHLSNLFFASPSTGRNGTNGTNETTGTNGITGINRYGSPGITEITGSGMLDQSSSNLSDASPSPRGENPGGLSVQEIADLRGYATRQLRLLGLFTNSEIQAFEQYVEDVVCGLGAGYLQNKMATDLPFETIRGTGPVFHPASLPPLISPEHRSPVSALAVRIDTRTVFSGHRNGVVCMWVHTACAAVFGARAPVPVSALLVTADGTLIVGSARALRALATDPPYSEAPGPTYEQPGTVTALAVTDWGVLFSGDSEGGIVVWSNGFANPGPYLRAHERAVTALCVAPRNDNGDGNGNGSTAGCFLYSGGADGRIRAWAFPECGPPAWEAQFNVQLGGIPVRALALSADGRALYSVRANGHVARWTVPGADKKCALVLSKLESGPVAVTERGLVLSVTNGSRHVAAWHVGELTPENVQFLKQSSDPRRPVACGGSGFPLGSNIFWRAQGSLGPLDEITVMKVVEIGASGCQALLVTGHKDGGVRISQVASW